MSVTNTRRNKAVEIAGLWVGTMILAFVIILEVLNLDQVGESGKAWAGWASMGIFASFILVDAALTRSIRRR